MALVYWSIGANGISMTCISAFKPGSPEQLSSLVTHSSNLSWFYRLPFIMFRAYVMMIYVETSYVYVYALLGFFFPSSDLSAKIQ